MKQKPRYVKISDGRTARVIVSLADSYVDYLGLVRLKVMLRKEK